MSLVEISDSAVTYLQDLLNSQEEETNIKIFVSDPGTMRAETCIVYCKVGEEEEVSIADVARSVAKALDFQGEVNFDTSKVRCFLKLKIIKY